MISKNIFKNTNSPFTSTYLNKLNINSEENSINDKKSSRCTANKTILFQKKNLLQKKPRIFSTKSQKIITKLNKNIKSATIKSPEYKKKIIYPIKLKQDKMIYTGISFYRNNTKNLRRNYSAYYIKSDLNLGQNYISDLMIQSNEINNNSKISEIEQKISKLSKTLNLFPSKSNNSFKLSRSFSSLSYKNDIKPKIKNSNIEKNSYNKNNAENKNFNYEKILLPDFLKNEFNIMGTDILSPFCIRARDSFILKKFDQYFTIKNNLKSDKKYINNKLNIIYAENEEAYNKKLSLINKKLNKQGKTDKYHIGLTPTEKLLRDIEKKVTFMRNIIEYAYPNTALMRLRIPEYKKYYNKFKYKNDFKKSGANNEKLNKVQKQIYKFHDKNLNTNFYRNNFSHFILYK